MGELTAQSRFYRNELLGLEEGIMCFGNSIDECEAPENDIHHIDSMKINISETCQISL